MKATKIMGAVFVALLAAALFTGAAAAETNNDYDVGVVYAYALFDETWAQGTTWSLVSDPKTTVTFVQDPESGEYYLSGKDLVEGKYMYTLGSGYQVYYMEAKHPTAAIDAVASYFLKGDITEKFAEVIGATVDTDKNLTFKIAADPDYPLFQNYGNIAWTNPKGTLTTTNFTEFNANVIGKDNYGNPTYSITAIDAGVWTVQAAFLKANASKLGFASTMPSVVYGKEYYFTVVKADDTKKIVALSDSVIQGDYVTFTVTAPQGTYNISNLEHGKIPTGQPNVVTTGGKYNLGQIMVPGSQTLSFSVKAIDSSDLKIEIDFGSSKKSVTVKVTAATITAEADVDSVYIGNEFDLEGTNDLGGSLYFYIKGTNYPFALIKDDVNSNKNLAAKGGSTWEATIKTAALNNSGKRPDAGTYTIYVVSPTNSTDAFLKLIESNIDNLDDDEYVTAYTTVTVALKQPFITITKAPEVVIQGDTLEVVGTAEGEPDEVWAYIFGTNKFVNKTVSVDDGEFTLSVDLAKKLEDETNAKPYLAAGQYFLVIQHPMYDKIFNIAVNGTVFYLNETADGAKYAKGTALFDTNERQSANAAKALCDELDQQKIDDMYVKASFIVAGPTSYVDPIPSQVTKGQVLTVSGTTTGHKNDVVVVELLSTAFAAMPKEAVGSASFVALTTKIGDDGVWSVSFDTSNLNADEYTCSVAVGQLEATTSKVTIVNGAQPQPTQTAGPGPQPTVAPTAQPTATPATPGFGALAALAGLGAVAVLLLRRQ